MWGGTGRQKCRRFGGGDVLTFRYGRIALRKFLGMENQNDELSRLTSKIESANGIIRLLARFPERRRFRHSSNLATYRPFLRCKQYVGMKLAPSRAQSAFGERDLPTLRERERERGESHRREILSFVNRSDFRLSCIRAEYCTQITRCSLSLRCVGATLLANPPGRHPEQLLAVWDMPCGFDGHDRNHCNGYILRRIFRVFRDDFRLRFRCSV